MPNVRRLCLKGKLSHDALQKTGETIDQRNNIVADQFREGMAALERQGWVPDIVISHSGWGCGLYVKQIWPQCRHISYLEWWFDARSALLRHDPENQDLGLGPNSSVKFWKRNQNLALELVCADAVVAPSKWQRAQLPPYLQIKCIVIPDGVDLTRFTADPTQRSITPLLTYGTRGMEPMRGFPEFVRELPDILSDWPELKVEIAGSDEIHYAGRRPEEGSWKRWAQRELCPWLTTGRVQWMGHLQPSDYVRWLQSSWCHVYLTQPFVASWSLLEAMACGCDLICSDVPPVKEFCSSDLAWLVDSRRRGFLMPPLVALRRGFSRRRTPHAESRMAELIPSYGENAAGWTRLVETSSL